MKKSKIITVLGLATIALSLSACSNNASSNKTANHAISSSKSNDKADDSKKAELASSKKNAEELANALKTDKVNFKGYVHGTFVDKKTNTWTNKYELPAPEPSTTISSFAKKHNLNKEQIEVLKRLDLDDIDTDPRKNDDGSLVGIGVFGSDLDSITKGYKTVSDVKVAKDDDYDKYVIKAKVTQHLENDIDTSTVSRDQSVSVDGKR